MFFLKNKIVQFQIIIYLISLIAPFYVYEAFLSYFKYKQIIEFNKSLEELNIFKDDLKKIHNPSMIKRHIGPAQILDENTKFLPLGGYSNSIVPFCNENGYWEYYFSDRYGFNNDNVIDKINSIVVGDSFAEGFCVKQNETISGVLNKLGITSFSIGKGGNASLLEYAALKEYFDIFNPKRVIWLHYENDIYDIDNEFKHQVLKQYLLNDNFRQNLSERSDEINIFYDQFRSNTAPVKVASLVLTFFKLSYTRQQIRNFLNAKFNYSPLNYNVSEEDFNLFTKIMTKIKIFSENKNFNFIFIYLPSYEQIYEVGNYKFKNELKYKIFSELEKIGIVFYDLTEPVFKNIDINYFPDLKYGLNLSFHYNKETYSKIGLFIKKVLTSEE